MLTVVNLFIYHSMLYARVNAGKFQKREAIHGYSTRNRGKLDVPRSRLEKTRRSCFRRGLEFLNKLPTEADAVSLNVFKRKTYSWLAENPFYEVNEFLGSSILIKY